jgi:hypothetical protein
VSIEVIVRDLLERAGRFEAEAHRILSTHESAPSRVVQLDKSYRDLSGLSIKQDELFRQALRCVEVGLFRAAHVLAWAGLMDFLEEKLAVDGLAKLRAARPNWKAQDLEELREYNSEYQIIEAAKELGLCTKNMMKALHGLLNKRNECAHPSDYFPDMNESLGYVSELFKRIAALQKRSI